MTQQRTFFDEPQTPSPPHAQTSTPPDVEPAPLWLQRMSLVVLVLFCLMLGVLVAVLPWSPLYWDRNGWMLAHPAVGRVLHLGFVRGFISGIGLIDIWIGVSEALHFRERRRAR